MAILIGLSTGLGAGFGFSWLVMLLLKQQKIYQTRQKAREIVETAKHKEEPEKEFILNKVEEHQQSLLEKQEHELEKIRILIRGQQLEQEQFQQNSVESIQKLNKNKNEQKNETEVCLSSAKEQKSILERINNECTKTQKEYLKALQSRFSVNVEQLKKDSVGEHVLRTKNQVLRLIKKSEEHFKHNLEERAHFILELVLSRFRHPYCIERGIRNVVFSSRKNMEYLLGPEDWLNMKFLEQECGVDLKVSDTEPVVTVFGIDPARRELGRACLQKIKSRKHLKKQDIKNLVKNTKKELFHRIRNDGERICRELRLKNLQREVKNLMGVLRYRYSFAQNQYFHCLEVGWLCGLLQSELGGGSVLLSRRAGMLHDIGKSIDHSQEGGHAMIGADFIKKHGESMEVVQAVRAHHHDVTPEKPMDFLVIGADALSGARPGARRSTVESYTQKILMLEKIGRSFHGVKDTYIMSAGREIRVIVNSQQVNDLQALKLSKKIADKIEEECSYPGLIKVTVVRTVTKNVNLQQLKQVRP